MNYSKNTGVPIVLVHHARKRQGAKQPRIRPLDDLRETGKIKDDAYYIVQVSRERERFDGDLAEFTDDTAPISEYDKAKTLVYLQKNRRKGEDCLKLIYFIDGKFYDRFT